jgi:hypothetical protein
MRKVSLGKMPVGTKVKLRPAVRRVFDGVELPSVEDEWETAPPTSPGAVIQIQLGTGHRKDLTGDQIREFQAGFLILRGRLTLTRWEASFEPLAFNDSALYTPPDFPSWRAWADAGAPVKRPR